MAHGLISKLLKIDNKSLNVIVLVLLSFSFLLSDWMVGSFSISEYVLVPLTVILIIVINQKYSKLDFRFLGAAGLFLILPLIISYFTVNDFGTKNALIGTFKLFFYITLIISAHRFISNRNLSRPFLVTLNIVAMISLFIGIYINFAIISEMVPYEFLWTFTRTDDKSYLFRGYNEIVRMRSLFSEPAHFGMFLNTVLAANLFNKKNIQVHSGFIYCIVGGVFLTLSFSSILILNFLLLYYLYLKRREWGKRLNKWFIFTFVVISGMIIFYFWDTIDAVLVERFFQIISGQDSSSFNRLLGSWQHVEPSTLLTGAGIGNSPNLFNIYAYALTDMGIGALLFMIAITAFIFKFNTGFGMLFLLVNFQRGGYLAPSYSIFVIIILIFMRKNTLSKRPENHMETNILVKKGEDV